MIMQKKTPTNFVVVISLVCKANPGSSIGYDQIDPPHLLEKSIFLCKLLKADRQFRCSR